MFSHKKRSRCDTLESLDQSKTKALDDVRESRKLLDRALAQVHLIQEEALAILGIRVEMPEETRKPRRDTGGT